MERFEQMNITRRPAQKKDIEFARRVHHEAYRDVVIRQFGTWDQKIQEKLFESEWKDGRHHEIILCGDKPCGYCSSQENDDQINCNELVILPEFQGQGIGTKILNTRIEEARRKNKPIRFQVLKANKAVDLYRKLGAEEIGETETHINMEFKTNKPM